MDFTNLSRINVVGTSGTGKSTFAKKLSKTLNTNYIEMDAIFWKSNWTESSDQEFGKKLEVALAPKSWVLDGNYNRMVPVKWKYTQTVIWIDYSFKRVLFQAFKRAIYRSLTKKELWPGTNNRESFRQSFLSKQSILLWTLKTYKTNKIRYEKMMSDPQFAHIQFIRLKNPKEVNLFLAKVAANKNL